MSTESTVCGPYVHGWGVIRRHIFPSTIINRVAMGKKKGKSRGGGSKKKSRGGSAKVMHFFKHIDELGLEVYCLK